MTGRFTLMMLCCSLTVGAAEFFMSPEGDDARSGSSAAEAWKSFDRAAKHLKPGDTLTLLPGVYHDGLELKFPGSDAVTTIRAAIPGTAILRGDVDAPEFTRKPGSKLVWQCKFPQLPEAVNERDSMLVYNRLPSVAELEFNPGSWHYDRAAGMLYISTGDFAPPSRHCLTISNLRRSGILLNAGRSGVHNVVIDGLVITGFNANSRAGVPGGHAKWGVYLVAPKKCTVRNVTAFLNGGGIGFSSRSEDSVIENCRTIANGSPFYTSGGNIIVLTPALRTAIRNCRSFDASVAGIRFYGGNPAQHCIFEDNISFDNHYGDMWLKYPSDTTTARRCVAGNALYSRLIENSIFNVGDTGYFGRAKNSIVRPRERGFDARKELADPDNFDYRPQKGSPYADRAPGKVSDRLLFAAVDGDDRADGNSVKTALKTLKTAAAKLEDGGTLYLLPGAWKGDLKLRNLKNVILRGRGAFPVAVRGALTLENCENVAVEQLAFDKIAFKRCRAVAVERCAATGALSADDVPRLRLTHNVFQGAVTLRKTPGAMVSGNIFDSGARLRAGKEVWRDFNSYAGKVPPGEKHSIAAEPAFGENFTLRNADRFDGRAADGLPIGPYRRRKPAAGLSFVGVDRLGGGSTTANIEFRTSFPATGVLRYGDTPACAKRLSFDYPLSFQTVSLTGLKPGTRCYFKISAFAKGRNVWTNAATSKSFSATSKVMNFTTPKFDPAPRTLHVATTGNDANPGSADKPWRTIGHAAASVAPGDTVLVHGGTYTETVRMRVTGDHSRPILFRAAPGEKAVLDGKQQIRVGVQIFRKNHLTLDRFYFREISEAGSFNGGIVLRNSDDISIRRCFYDGRSNAYTPYFVWATGCRNLSLDNCFLTRGFSGMSFSRCPDLSVTHSVIYINQVTSCRVNNRAGEKAVFANNIWVDNTLQKVGNSLLWIYDGAALEERDSCYLLRVPEDQKRIFSYQKFNGKALPSTDGGEVLTRQWRRQGRFGVEIATYDEYLRRSGRPGTARFVDPGFKALKKFIRFKDLADWEKNYRKFGKEHQRDEYHRVNGRFAPLDFPDFFATNPELVKNNIGLQPEKFGD